LKLTVDPGKCTLCKACVATCPSDMVRLKRHAIRIGRVGCIRCGHCIAVCPEGAIADEEATSPPLPLAGETPAPPTLRALFQRRRSVRRYAPKPVPRALLDDILDVARWAPTAANGQPQEYVVVESPEAKRALRERIEAYYVAFAEAMADSEHREERLLALGVNPDEARHPHVEAAVPALVKHVEAGRDRLFFDAPVVIVVHADAAAVMPDSACGLATMSLILMAEAHGLGTCLTGYATDALRLLPEARAALGLPVGNQVHQVIVLGWPVEGFRRVPERDPVKASWL